MRPTICIERDFLAEKYGDEVIEATVQAATNLDPQYEESTEEIPE